MKPNFITRRAIQLGLTVNALRPLPGEPLAFPTFFAGWLTGELAPQLLALTALDTAAHVARHGIRTRGDKLGVAMAGLTAAGLATLITSSRRAEEVMTTALEDGLGPHYQDGLDPVTDLGTTLAQLALPFRVRSANVRRHHDIAYAPGGRRFMLDVYYPREPVEDRPVLLQVHGGAWVIGNKEQQGLPLMMHMAERGWICVAINYPLSPAARWPQHIIAAKRAIGWIRENIHTYGGDPAFLAVTGGSAGGHLASLLALTQNDAALQPGFADQDTSVQACVPHYGVYDFAATTGERASTARLKNLISRYVFETGHDPVQHLDDYVAASPLDRITDAAPPFFVVHGERDSLVPVGEAREFVRRLRETSHHPVAYAEVPGAQHAFDLFPSIRSAAVVRGVERFLSWSHHNWRKPAL